MGYATEDRPRPTEKVSKQYH